MTIAKLNTMLTGDASGFNSAMDGVQKRAAATGLSVDKTFSGLMVLGRSLMGILLPLIPLLGAVGVASEAVDVYKFARSIGVAASEVVGLEQALKSVGSNADAAKSIFASLASNIATLGKGNVIFADTLDRLGVDAKQLATLPPPKALELIVGELAKIEDKQKRAALATQIFGSDAAAILPIVERNAQALGDATKQAESLGTAISDQKLSKIEQGQIAWERFETMLDGIALTIASELMPHVVELINMLPDIGSVMGEVRPVIVFNLKASILFIRTLGLIPDVLKLVSNTAISTALLVASTALRAVSTVAKAIKSVLESIGIAVPTLLDTVASAATAMYDLANEFGGDALTNVENLARGFDDIVNAITDVKSKSDSLDFDKTLKADGAVAIANSLATLFAKGLEVVKEFQTPLQRFNARIEELNAMLEVGAISWEVYARATHDAVNQLEKAHELQRMGLSAATEAGTVEAYSSILTSQQQENMSMRETPMERTNRILQDSKEIEKRIAENTEKTAEAVKSITVVKI